MIGVDVLRELRGRRRATLDALTGLPDDRLEVHVGPDRPTDVRAAILALGQEDDRRGAELAALLASLSWQPTAAQRILPALAGTRGRLRAALVGLSDAELDLRPSPDEWAIRETIRHLMNNEARFVVDSAYAVERSRGDESRPLRRPGEPAGPGSLGPELPGGVETVLEALEDVRDRLISGAAVLTAADLEAPMPWAGLTVNVGFMLHRRATHERQHTVQILKILRAIDHRASEVHLLLGEVEIARADLEATAQSLPGDLLDATRDGRSMRALLRQVIKEEAARVEAIISAVGT